jgi:hypothetical protein
MAVVSTILGQGLLLGKARLLEYGGLVWHLFHLFVVIYEEPTLGRVLVPSTLPSVAKSRGGFPVTPWAGHPDV